MYIKCQAIPNDYNIKFSCFQFYHCIYIIYKHKKIFARLEPSIFRLERDKFYLPCRVCLITT